MTLNPPHKIRAAIYIGTALLTPVAVYLKAKGLIGDLELTLWSAEVTAANILAGLNAGPASRAVGQINEGMVGRQVAQELNSTAARAKRNI